MTRTAQTATLVVMLTIAAAMPLIHLHPAISWHDQQRVMQVGLIVLASAALAFMLGLPSPLGRATGVMLLAILGPGFASATQAAMPLWALTELALFAGSFTLVLAVRALRTTLPQTDDWLILAAAGLCLGVGMKFLVAYFAAVTDPGRGFYVYEMLDGFSNRRFFGQVATLLIPVLLAGPFFNDHNWPRRYAMVLWSLAALVWFVVIATGTRGTWLALAVSSTLLFVAAGPAGRKLAMAITSSGLAGLALTYVLMTLVPDFLGNTVSGHPSGRLTTSLSGREFIWAMSLDMIRSHPLLGVGPMHFAAHLNPVAAHPHNALLQLAAEWGLPTTLLILLLTTKATVRLLGTIRAHRHNPDHLAGLRLALFAALTGATVQAMVDGVIVMPTTMVWGALLIGWLWALQPEPGERMEGGTAVSSQPRSNAAVLQTHTLRLVTVVSALMLTWVVARDVPRIIESASAESPAAGMESARKPRFWVQGFIVNQR